MSLIWMPAQLAMLAKVVDLNGFSAAARALGGPKAAVSRAVADLEKSLGGRGLERPTRGSSPPPAGGKPRVSARARGCGGVGHGARGHRQAAVARGAAAARRRRSNLRTGA